jgi:hypothetical protein
MSIDEICDYLKTALSDQEIATRVVGLLREGHQCRVALVSLCPDSTYASDVVEQYDHYWLGA